MSDADSATPVPFLGVPKNSWRSFVGNPIRRDPLGATLYPEQLSMLQL